MILSQPYAESNQSRISFTGNRIVRIKVGANNREFFTHKPLLCSRSKFFENCLKDGTSWAEAEDEAIKLPDDNADTFARYVDLIYTGKLPVTTISIDSTDPTANWVMFTY
jgi:hypothetical protein